MCRINVSERMRQFFLKAKSTISSIFKTEYTKWFFTIVLSLGSCLVGWHINEEYQRNKDRHYQELDVYRQLLRQGSELVELIYPLKIDGIASVLPERRHRLEEAWINFEKLYWGSSGIMEEKLPVEMALKKLRTQFLMELMGFPAGFHDEERSRKALQAHLALAGKAIIRN